LSGELHNRMPVVLKPGSCPFWLGEAPADAQHLKAQRAPYSAEKMTCWPVSQWVGNVRCEREYLFGGGEYGEGADCD